MVTAAPGQAVARPDSLAAAHQVMVDSAAAGQAVTITGGGTKADWGAPGRPADLVLSTSGLDALVAHNHGDLTAVVGAGMPLSRLQAHLAEAGQWLAIDPPSGPGGATVGGLLAAGEAGPRRHRYGSLRELVIGVTVVLSDGAVARSGGQVIKNVAGYDLAKLFHGSLGTLGLVAEASLRLHPLAPASATLRVAAGPERATGLVLSVLAAPVVPSAVDVADGAVWIRIEGREAGVHHQCRVVTGLATSAGLPAEVLEGEDEARAWADLAGEEVGGEGQTVARAAALPSRLAEVAGALERAAGESGVGATLVSRAGLGLHSAVLSGEVAGQAAAVTAWRAAVARLGGTVVVRRRPPGLAEAAEVWGPAPSAVAVMRRVKAELDPAGRMSPGRFAPWW